MRIQDLKNPLNEIPPERIMDIMYTCNDWFSGAFMIGAGPPIPKLELKRLLTVGSLYKIKPRRSVRLYRYWNVKIDQPMGLLVGKTFTGKTSKRKLQSWTYSLSSAEEFYLYVGRHGFGHKGQPQGTKPLIVSSVFGPNEIILTYEDAYTFFRDASRLMKRKRPDLAEHVARMVEDMEGWNEQKEIVVYTGTDRRIRVEKDLAEVKS